jgi:hypothetical protein
MLPGPNLEIEEDIRMILIRSLCRAQMLLSCRSTHSGTRLLSLRGSSLLGFFLTMSRIKCFLPLGVFERHCVPVRVVILFQRFLGCRQYHVLRLLAARLSFRHSYV